MQKNMYSLILSEPVVERIDQLAYRKGISRSQLIDQLLAREVGLYTQEQKLRMVIEQVANIVQDQTPLQVKVRSDMGGLQFASYLRYKYNPGIRYHVEFQNQNGHMVGVLKVQSRSTSEDLLMHLSNFFRIFTAIDTVRFKEFHRIPVSIQLSQESSSKFARVLVSPQMSLEEAEPELVAEYLSNYIMMLDEELRCYFMNLGNPEVAQKMDLIYCKYMQHLRIG